MKATCLFVVFFFAALDEAWSKHLRTRYGPRFPVGDDSYSQDPGSYSYSSSNDDGDDDDNNKSNNVGEYYGSDELFREDRGLTKPEPQPLCKEIRTEIPSHAYMPLLDNAEGYTLRPQRIFMVNCSREVQFQDILRGSDGGCWPRHCREKYVDIDIFGKPKTVKENLWQLMMELPSVPIACECFKMP